MLRRRSVSRQAPKRRRMASTGRTRGRVVGPRSQRSLLVRPRLPLTFTGGDSIVRRFRRMATDCTVFGLGGGTIGAVYQGSGLQPPWFGLGTPAGDTPYAPNLVQFGVATVWRFSDIIDAGQMSNLFNEYQIHKIELRFQMDNAPAYSQGDGNNPNAIPSVYIRYDPNDATIPLSDLVVVNGGDTQYRSLRDPFTYTFYPRPAQPMYASSIAQGYAFPTSSRQLWLDTSPPSNNIEHYGVKMWFRNFNSANQVGLGVRIQPTFYYSMRRVR